MATTGRIPLRNIWLLFLYAADLVRFRDQLEGEVEAARDLPDLVGRILAHVVEKRLRRNLSRGYRPRAAVLSRVRGRIDMLETTTAQLLERGRVACRFDDHTMNTPRNRLVRAALDRLAARVLDPDTAHRCRALAADLSRMGVGGAQPSRAEMSIDAIGRNETADRLMVTLSGMVFDLVIPTEDPGDSHLNAQDASEQLVRRLFEPSATLSGWSSSRKAGGLFKVAVSTGRTPPRPRASPPSCRECRQTSKSPMPALGVGSSSTRSSPLSSRARFIAKYC